MMKKFYLIFLIFSLRSFAQNEQQSIELPDFVITGKQSIEIQTAQKPKIELISILSKDFFTPQYSTEELPLLINSVPTQILPTIKFSQDYYTGKVNLMLGKYTYPLGELFLTKSFDNYLINAKVWGSNTKEYIPHAGYNNSGFQFNNDLFISTKSDFLPGTKFNIDATYWRDSYKFFGSINPTEKRETNNFNAKLSVVNKYLNYFHFGLNAIGDIYKINENNLKEIYINTNVFVEFSLKDFIIGGNVEYQKQSLNDDVLKERNYNNFDSKGYVEIIPFDFLKVKGGIAFNSNSKFNFFSPFANAEMKLDNNLSLAAEFNPHVELLTTKNFVERNLYSNLTLDNSFVKYKNSVSGNIKYQFKKTFSSSLTFNYSSIDNYVYYEDVKSIQKYDLLSVNDISKYSLTANFYLYRNEFGNFFSELTYQSVKDKNGNYIPYEPNFKTKLSYNYDFNFGLGFTVSYNYYSNSYADLMNKIKVEDYSNLSTNLYYEVFEGMKLKLDFQNILNRSNFVWQHYKEKPFDYIAGIEYRW